MKKILLIVCFAISITTLAQNKWGVGIRLGDPSGLTLKKYMSTTAIELNVGRTHWFYSNNWYNKRFDKWYNGQKFGYNDFQYIGYKVSTPIALQLHYLFRKDIKKIADNEINGLQYYLGFGGQVAFQKYNYDYRYKLKGDPNWYYETGGRVIDFDLGVDGVAGLEYTFEEIPISLFLDVTLFMELANDPFLFHFQSGIGGRYNF